MPESASPSPDPLTRRPVLIGMVHLGPTPGAPAYETPRSATEQWIEGVVGRALDDAQALADAGFDAVLVENHGDAPFYAGRVPAETVAAMTLAVSMVQDALPATVGVGVNVLRNDAPSALGIAAAAGLDFVRVNVLTGAYVTDQGLIEGRAADVLRRRARLAPGVRICADLRVKHARPLVERPLPDEARELVERAGADAVIVSGRATGAPVDLEELVAVRSAVGDHPILIGSGASAATIGALLEHADGAIVGTALKQDGVISAPVDPDRARAFVDAARA